MLTKATVIIFDNKKSDVIILNPHPVIVDNTKNIYNVLDLFKSNEVFSLGIVTCKDLYKKLSFSFSEAGSFYYYQGLMDLFKEAYYYKYNEIFVTFNYTIAVIDELNKLKLFGTDTLDIKSKYQVETRQRPYLVDRTPTEKAECLLQINKYGYKNFNPTSYYAVSQWEYYISCENYLKDLMSISTGYHFGLVEPNFKANNELYGWFAFKDQDYTLNSLYFVLMQDEELFIRTATMANPLILV